MTPLYEPAYGIGFREAVSRFFLRWNRFKGRSSRSEYWWVTLFLVLVAVIYQILIMLAVGTTAVGWEESFSTVPGTLLTVAYGIFSLVTLVPSLSLTWRRLHDAGFAGPWYFLSLIPIGGIAVFIMTILGSRPEAMKPKWEDRDNFFPGF